MLLYLKEVFIGVIKLRALNVGDDTGLSRSAVNAFTNVHRREAEGDLTHVQKRRQGEGGDRNSSVGATSLGKPATTRSCKRQRTDSSLQPLG